MLPREVHRPDQPERARQLNDPGSDRLHQLPQRHHLHRDLPEHSRILGHLGELGVDEPEARALIPASIETSSPNLLDLETVALQ